MPNIESMNRLVENVEMQIMKSIRIKPYVFSILISVKGS